MAGTEDPHSSNSIRNYIDSLRSLDEKLAKENPDWSPQQVRAQRHFRWKFGGMGKAQLDSFKAEERGDKEIHSREAYWNIVDGNLEHPDYGSFDKVIQHAKSEEERVSLIAWRNAVISAESGTQFISLDYHNGTEIRYADAWEKDANGRIKQIVRTNITDGKDLNNQQALSFLSQLTRNGRELVVDKTHDVGFVIVKPTESIGRNITREVSVTGGTFIAATKGTVREVGYTVQSVQRYIEKQREEKSPTSVDVWKRIVESGKRRVKKIVRAVQPIEIKSKDRKQPRNAKRLRVGLKGMVAEDSVIQRKKSIARHERRNTKRKIRKETRSLFRIKPELQFVRNKKQTIVTETKPIRVKRKLATFEQAVRSKIKIKKERHHIKPKEHRIEKVKRREQMVRLFAHVKKLLAIKEKMINSRLKKREKIQTPSAEKKQKIKEMALNFSIVFILWYLIADHYHTLFRDSGTDKKTQKKLEKVIPTYTSPWLLLAIIWHLAMIRESRGAGSGFAGQGKQKKVKKKTPYKPIAPHGVIFVYAT